MMRHVISLIGNEIYIQITTKMSTNENYYNMHYGVSWVGVDIMYAQAFRFSHTTKYFPHIISLYGFELEVMNFNL